MNHTGPDDDRIVPIAELRRAISEARFATFLAVAQGDERKAWALYEWNIDVAAALVLPLNALEIALRNALYDAGARTYGSNWLSTTRLLRGGDVRQISEATSYLQARGTAPTADALVAELSLGFWVGLVARHHDQTLWRQSLYRAFRSGTRRPELHEKLDRLRTLRNRIAHHEHVLRRNLPDDLDRIESVLDQLSSATADWVRSRSDARAVIGHRRSL